MCYKKQNAMWNRFTKEAKAWVEYAQGEAGRCGTYAVSPEHFLLALLREGGNDPALALLKQLGADIEVLQASVEDQMERARTGTLIWPPRPKLEGHSDNTPAPANTPMDAKNRDEFRLDAYSMHLIGLVQQEAKYWDREEISSILILLGLVRQDQVRRDERMAIRLFVETEITLRSAREAVAKLEGYDLPPLVPQKVSVWKRLLGKKQDEKNT